MNNTIAAKHLSNLNATIQDVDLDIITITIDVHRDHAQVLVSEWPDVVKLAVKYNGDLYSHVNAGQYTYPCRIGFVDSSSGINYTCLMTQDDYDKALAMCKVFGLTVTNGEEV